MPRMSSLPSDFTTDSGYNGKVAQTMKVMNNLTPAKNRAECHGGLETRTCIWWLGARFHWDSKMLTD